MPSKKKKRKPKTTTAPGKSSKEKQACPYCGKEFIRLGRHLSSCPQKPKNAEDKKEEKEDEE